MIDQFCVGTSTIHKYMNIIIDVLFDEQFFFAPYIFLLQEDRL